MKKLVAIAFIWMGCAIAWTVLGSTLVVRSGESTTALSWEVHRLWGAPGVQAAPSALYRQTEKVRETVTSSDAQGRPVKTVHEKEVVQTYPVPLEGSDLGATVALEHRRKGLMWFPTYEVDFRGRYAFENPTDASRVIEIAFPLATENAIFDGFEVTAPEGATIPSEVDASGARWTASFAPGERREFDVRYRSRGTGSWTYQPTEGTGRVRDFRLEMKTDFAAVDFPAGTISPTTHQTAGSAWTGVWDFESLVTSAPIGITLPERLNPGPLASRITFFAPVGLLFFFFVIAVFGTAQGRGLHPMHYFFLGCAFFAFHLLFAYLVDHLAIAASFAIASAVSIFLVVSYARLFVGWTFALREMAIAQLLYLVLFSWTFFWSGYTGLAITVGAILTLFVMMQVTGRVDWSGVRPPKKSVPA